ncbi:bifunctional 3,4-dihydroxy-2-butanone-4-phosphate synthase/GTP cyclohydrolase II (plasmid) [Rhizobium leguminosarum]
MPFSTISQAIEAIANGEMIVVVDDENRENEGDILVAADKITPEHVAFMMRHARGLICVPLLGERLDELDVPLMVIRNSDSLQTAFTVSVDYNIGTTTGISAEDRAATIRALVDSKTKPSELSRPGHIFPLRANPRGVLGRPGHTEAAIDFSRLAGLSPAGVICEIANDDGSMSRLPELMEFAAFHGLHVVTIEALIEHCRASEPAVKRYSSSKMPTRFGEFSAVTFRDEASGVEHIALTYGNVSGGHDIPTRVHSECLTGEVFRSLRCDCGEQLEMSMRAIRQAEVGCIVYLRGQEGRGIGLGNKIAAYGLQDSGMDTLEANHALGFPSDARHFSAAADILADLGIQSVRLLTNNPGKLEALRAAGVTVTSRQSLIAATNATNISYLRTKRDRFGHLLENDQLPGQETENVVSVWSAKISAGPLG